MLGFINGIMTDWNGSSIIILRWDLCLGKTRKWYNPSILRISTATKILQTIDKTTGERYSTVVVQNKSRKRLINDIKNINAHLPLGKEERFFRLIRPRQSWNQLGQEVKKKQLVSWQKSVNNLFHSADHNRWNFDFTSQISNFPKISINYYVTSNSTEMEFLIILKFLKLKPVYKIGLSIIFVSNVIIFFQ